MLHTRGGFLNECAPTGRMPTTCFWPSLPASLVYVLIMFDIQLFHAYTNQCGNFEHESCMVVYGSHMRIRTGDWFRSVICIMTGLPHSIPPWRTDTHGTHSVLYMYYFSAISHFRNKNRPAYTLSNIQLLRRHVCVTPPVTPLAMGQPWPRRQSSSLSCSKM